MAAIGEVLEKHMIDTGFVAPHGDALMPSERRAVAVAAEGAPAALLPALRLAEPGQARRLRILHLLRLFALRIDVFRFFNPKNRHRRPRAGDPYARLMPLGVWVAA